MSAQESDVYWKIVGDGPHVCAYDECKFPDVLVLRDGNHAVAGIVHHIDEDRSNNERSNLAPMHLSCHIALHHAGVPLGPLSDSTKGRMLIGQRKRRDLERERGLIGKVAPEPITPVGTANRRRAGVGRDDAFPSNRILRIAIREVNAGVATSDLRRKELLALWKEVCQ